MVYRTGALWGLCHRSIGAGVFHTNGIDPSNDLLTIRDDSVNVLGQRKNGLHSNASFHWLIPDPEWALIMMQPRSAYMTLWLVCALIKWYEITMHDNLLEVYQTNCSHSDLHYHDDVIKWRHFPHYWSVVRGIHRRPRSLVDSLHKGQWSFDVFFDLRLNKW